MVAGVRVADKHRCACEMNEKCIIESDVKLEVGEHIAWRCWVAQNLVGSYSVMMLDSRVIYIC